MMGIGLMYDVRFAIPDPPDLRFLNPLDYAVIGLYLLLVAGAGVYVARFNRDTGDYFKGGGRIPWGLSMVSLFISGFSAFMFVGAAGVTYKDGGGALVLFTLAAPAYLLGWAVYGPLWRRTRIDTPMEFLSRRFSTSTTYFYTLLAVVPNVLTLGILIYTLCIFVSTALGFNAATFDLGVAQVNGFQLSILATGGVMVIYTLFGGLWAVMVTDALQFVILLLVTLLLLPIAYVFLGDGSLTAGIARLARDAPEGYFDLSLTGRPALFWGAYLVNIVMGYNVNWHIAQRYYSVPNERDTRKMALWCAGLGLVLPLMWILPVMATPILFPDMASLWPELREPSEAAFVTLALAVLPHGLLGFMVAAIFAATMSSVDTTINWLSAVVTHDAYVPVARRLRGQAPSDRAQLVFARGAVAVMGIFAIWMALTMERYGGAFDVYLRADSLYRPAMFVPLMLGLVITRTPWWSGMASFGAGVVAIFAAAMAANHAQGIPVDSFGAFFTPLTVHVAGLELGRYEMNTLVGVGVSALVFLGSMVFKRRPAWYAARVEALEADLKTPVLDSGEPADLRGARAYRLAGRLTLVMGGLLLLIAVALPDGRWLNAAGGVLGLAIGGALIGFVGRYRPGQR
ncbi:MAG: hypothetical protein R2834_01800 [Rhodothermales bacterium]